MKTASNMNARIQLFTSMLSMIIKSSVRSRAGLLLWISCLDAVNAASKIALVLVIALSVRVLGSEVVNQEFYGYSFEKTESLIYVFGAMIGVIALVSALSAYASAVYSRQLGRWANRKSFEELKAVLGLNPREAQYSQFSPPSNINVILMQLPLHTGLAYETVVRMINPFLLLIFSAAALFYQSALFSTIIVGLSLLVIPIVLSTSLSIQRNARSFYGAQSLNLGSEVAKTTNVLSNQHGICQKSAKEELSYSKAFFDSFDVNILANHKTGLIISVLDAVARPILFMVVGTLVFTGKFSIDAAIAFLGSLAYLLASSRSVMASLTNLLRFQPQVQQYQELTAAARSGSTYAKNLNTNLLIEDETQEYIAQILFPRALSTLNLSKYIQPIRLWAAKRNVSISDDIYFVNASFRFKEGTTILDQLKGANRDNISTSEIKLLCSELKALKGFESQKEGVNTKMSEQAWATMDSAARVALRTIPLALKSEKATVFIDASIIKSLNPQSHSALISQFKHLRLVIFSNGDYVDIPNISDYALFEEAGTIQTGNKEWFKDELQKSKKDKSPASADPNLDQATLM